MLEARPLREPWKCCPDVIGAIGNTPLVELKRLSPKPGVRLFAKLEFYSPTGSVKDRVAKSMMERAEAEGAIAPGQRDPRADVGQHRHLAGDDLPAEGLSVHGRDAGERHGGAHRAAEDARRGDRLLRGSKGSNGAVEMALEMAEKDPSFYMPYQYGNQANPDAHYYGTAQEIIDDLGDVTAFVAGLGTGGTLMGNGRRLKEHDPNTKIVAAEPLQGEDVQGLRSLDDGFIPPIIDISVLDRKILVSNRDGIIWTRKLFEEEGIFAGVSSGAIASVAVRIANELDEGNVVFLVADDGNKYMSAGLWTKSIDELESVDSTVWW